jgi:hypothetical protein
MKTAMQELIDELESINSYPMMPLILRLMKDRLEREKEQILNDYMEGVNAGVLYSNGKVFISKEEYYNRTYTQDRELGKEVTDLLENYKKDKTFKQKSKWTKL